MANESGAFDATDSFLLDPNIRFPHKPILLPDLGIYHMPEGIGVQFRGGPTTVALRGRLAKPVFEYLFKALDGTKDLKTLLAECKDAEVRSELPATLALLHTKGLLLEADINNLAICEKTKNTNTADALDRQLLFWGRNLGISGYLKNPNEVQEKIDKASILLIGTGLFGSLTYDLLNRSGVADIHVIGWDDDGAFVNSVKRLSPTVNARQLDTTDIDKLAPVIRSSIKGKDLLIAATRNASIQLFQKINRISLDAGCSTLYGNEDGTEFRIGPFVIPYASACYACRELRRASAQDNMLEEHVFHSKLAETRKSACVSPKGESIVSATLGASLLASEALRILTGIAMPTLLNAEASMSTLTGEFANSRILRVPRCPECRKGTRLPIVLEADAIQQLQT